MNKEYIFILFSVSMLLHISVITVDAQQLPVFSQYMLNGFLINPAVAGHEGYTTYNLTARKQWIGMKGAPQTYSVSYQTRLLKNSYISHSVSIRKRRKIMSRSGRVGYGAYAYTDMAGAFNRTGLQGTYTYLIPFDRSQVSFGVSVIGYQFRIDKDKIRTTDNDDPLLLNAGSSAFIPDANIGVYFTNKDLYAGISAMQLFQSPIKIGVDKNGPTYRMIRHYYLMAGYQFEVGEDLLLEPSFLFKSTEKFVSQIDINAKLYIKENYWAGISYRTGGSYGIAEESLNGRGATLVFMVGMKVNKYYVGYAGEYNFNAIGFRTWGSYEIMIAAKFGDNARRYRWLNKY
jgi:type IX secretion system PorP/SprF family membrane protein